MPEVLGRIRAHSANEENIFDMFLLITSVSQVKYCPSARAWLHSGLLLLFNASLGLVHHSPFTVTQAIPSLQRDKVECLLVFQPCLKDCNLGLKGIEIFFTVYSLGGGA